VNTALAPVIEDSSQRELALLKAVGLDRVSPEQRELAIAIANRYELDLMLKHLVLIDGRPYITRDGLLHVAHRSGQFDGIEASPVTKSEDGKYLRCTVSVWRKDMTRPFTYTGRYPAQGRNAAYNEEMAVKVGEVMSLRRAFDVSAPTVEERWDAEIAADPPPAKKSLAEKVAEKVAEVVSTPPDPVAPPAADPQPAVPQGASDVPVRSVPAPTADAEAETCGVGSPYDPPSPCVRESGHSGTHRSGERETWA
jgi:hypothetical protein